MRKTKHQFYLDIEHRDAIEEIIKEKDLAELNFSQVVRYIILDYYSLITKKADPDVRLNAMSKELSMVLNLVTSLVSKVDASQVRNDDVLQFHQAEKYVEQLINENKKWKNNNAKKPKVNSVIEENLVEKTFDAEKVKVKQKQIEKERLEERNDDLAKYLDSI